MEKARISLLFAILFYPADNHHLKIFSHFLHSEVTLFSSLYQKRKGVSQNPVLSAIVLNFANKTRMKNL